MHVFANENSVALSEQNPPNEIIIAFEKLSDKQLLELDEAFTLIPGVKNFGYCQRKKLYFFSYDEDKYKNEEQVLEAIYTHTKKYLPLHKIGATSEQILKTCNN